MFLDSPKSYMQIMKRTFETIQRVSRIFSFNPQKQRVLDSGTSGREQKV